MKGHINLPNFLSLLRILLIPLIFYLYGTGANLICGAVFLLAILTDYYDGYFARKLNQSSHFGSILDPVADKIFELLLLYLISG